MRRRLLRAYRVLVSSRRTLWTEGRHRGRLVGVVAAVAVVLASALDLSWHRHLGLLFDLVFVLACVGAALAVRPADFFVTGVLPPLLMLGTVVVLAATGRSLVADARDGLVQAVVSGLAHRAGALVAGYLLTLAVLALRQVALRHHGALRARPAPRPSRGTSARGRPAARVAR